MTIVTSGPTMAPEHVNVSDYQVGYGSSIAAAAAESWAESPVSQLATGLEIADAKGERPHEAMAFDPMGNTTGFNGVELTEQAKPAVPRIDMIDALDQVKKAGLQGHLTLPNQPDMPPAQLAIMIRNAQARRDREATMERGPQGFVPNMLQAGTSFFVGAADPINLASAFVPVMGELRYGKMLAAAGDSVAERLAVRAGVGAAQGAVGQAALEPLDWWSHTQEGRDFGMADVLHNIMFGAALGGALHAGGGYISDAYRGAKGRALYPFGPGEPLEQVSGVGTHVPATALTEDGGVTAIQAEQHFRRLEPGEQTQPGPNLLPNNAETDALIADVERQLGIETPSPAVQTINDLPPRAHEDAMRTAIADLINGDAVRSGDVLAAAAETDPRIAESFRAFHGSPADFERFDLSKINTGEGAQSYGHGLYFAENDEVARRYQRTVSDKALVNKVAQLYDEGFSPADAWGEIKDHWSEFSPGEQRLMLALEKDDWFGFEYPHQAVNAALRDLRSFDPSPETVAAVNAIGNLYRVKIKADKAHMLDWDRGFEGQSSFVQDALRKLGFNEAEVAGAPGKEFHTWLAKQAREAIEASGGEVGPGDTRRAAAARLAEVGVPGIKYLDRGSRAGGEHTQNFVVFDDKDIEITHKNGEPVKREEFLAERAAEKAQQNELTTGKQLRGRAAADPQTWSLFEFLAHEGGLKPDQELNAIFGSSKSPFVPGFGTLVRKNGRSLDEALRLAKDHGYLFDAADVTGAEGSLVPRDLLDRLAEENAGRKQYRQDQQHATKAQDTAAAEREKHEVISALHDEIEATSGQKGVKIDPALEDRVVEIIQREAEHDVLAAYERAIMEDHDRYEASHSARSQDAETSLPGWDVPGDAGAASPDGGAAAGQRGQAGASGAGPRRADGGQPRARGEGDRGALPAQLDDASNWRQIAHVTPDFDQPDVIAASKAADRVEQPKGKLDDRVAASEKAEAYARSMYDMFAHRLPEEERARLEEMITTLDRRKADEDTVNQRGAACLFEGGGA